MIAAVVEETEREEEKKIVKKLVALRCVEWNSQLEFSSSKHSASRLSFHAFGAKLKRFKWTKRLNVKHPNHFAHCESDIPFHSMSNVWYIVQFAICSYGADAEAGLCNNIIICKYTQQTHSAQKIIRLSFYVFIQLCVLCLCIVIGPFHLVVWFFFLFSHLLRLMLNIFGYWLAAVIRTHSSLCGGFHFPFGSCDWGIFISNIHLINLNALAFKCLTMPWHEMSRYAVRARRARAIKLWPIDNNTVLESQSLSLSRSTVDKKRTNEPLTFFNASASRKVHMPLQRYYAFRVFSHSTK